MSLLSCLQLSKYFFCEKISRSPQKINFKKACFSLLKFAQKFCKTFKICTLLSVGDIEKFDVNNNFFDSILGCFMPEMKILVNGTFKKL